MVTVKCLHFLPCVKNLWNKIYSHIIDIDALQSLQHKKSR